MPDEQKGETLRLLAERGFALTDTRGGSCALEGELKCSKGPVRVEIRISDWDFLSYPVIKLLDRPAFLPALMPHVGVNGDLCYFTHGAAVLDRYDPATSIDQCLSQASRVLNQIATDPEYRHGDIQDEFLAHWEFGQDPAPWSVLIGTILDGENSADYIKMDARGAPGAIIASDYAEAQLLALAIGGKVSKTSCKCWLLRTDELPAVPERMPTSIRELFRWLQQWDRGIYNGVQRVLEREPEYLAHKFVTFAVFTPLGWLGFGFDLDQVKRLGYAKRPDLYKQYLHGKGGASSILRLSITDCSPQFVHSRNFEFETLRDKKIAIVGCGAIGSYLAQSLVRLGAGQGKGALALVDHETLQPENLGRHVLGYPGLFQNKAEALQAEFKRQFPLSNIEAVKKDVKGYPQLFGLNLVIDATGEEAVSEFLNGSRIERATKVPILHVWIKGNGECVQALWADRCGFGCFGCLRVTDAAVYRTERFPVLPGDALPRRGRVGCHAFTPYAVSAPMAAAALATDVIIDWIKGDPSPRFRTRSVENSHVNQVKNQNISRIKNCPACGNQ